MSSGIPMDPNLQRIIDRSSGQHAEQRQPTFNFQPARPRSATWGFGQGSRLPLDEPLLLEEAAPVIPTRDSYTIEHSRQPYQLQNEEPKRLSLPPRNIYNGQEGSETRHGSNAENIFKFGQNLRHGLPMNNRQSMAHPPLEQSPISQLATGMVHNRVLQQPPSSMTNLSLAMHTDRFQELQPPKQQITPPFNLSGYIYSPDIAQKSTLSSPPDISNSSPSARIIQRRAINRPIQRIEATTEDRESERYTHHPQTPQRQTIPSSQGFSRPIPQTQSLGHAPPMAHGIQLVSPHELPDRFRQVFPYELFNAPQSKCFDPIYKSNDNVVIAAPTGSGKTAMFELAICKLVEGHRSGEFKIVYQAPTKSLCSERMRDWEKKFSHLNLPCAELTGDTSQFEMAKVRNASIIVTTPEKWDSITRKWSDFSKLLEMVKLFLIDEVHILKDNRGATLEAVVSRMKKSGVSVRFVALSATVPNSNDIATWLGKDSSNQHLPAHRETFGEDFRPVKLQKHVHGYDGTMNDYAFEKVLEGKLPNLIQKYTHKKPIMVFCFTRKSCERAAEILAESWTRQRVVDRAWPAPTQRTAVGNKELQDLVGSGVAFHHAGLDLQDRHAVETAYLKGDISVICCTSTLAVGVNLPCHLVVLKGTVGIQDAGVCEYSDLEVMQMLGRAGRPQFDNSAVAIIMTRSNQVDRYKKMIAGQDILESTLHLNLIEHLNSEIGLRTIRDLNTAKTWLAGTFLSVRMKQNPSYYKLEGIDQSRNTDDRIQLVCERDIKLLQDSELVTSKDSFTCTEYGHAMSRYMVQFETMRLLLSLASGASTEEILLLLCQASEFKDLRIKPIERGVLRELNKSPLIKYKVKENVSTTAQKVFIIIQAQLGGVDASTIKDFPTIKRQYLVDQNIIFDRSRRLIRCIIDCKVVDCDAISTRHALDLSRSLSAEYWENSNLQLRQVPGVGPAATRKLVSSSINSIEKLTNLDTATLERIMTRNPPFGRKMLDSVRGFPRLTLASEIMGRMPRKAGENPRVKVKSHLGYKNTEIPTWNKLKPALTFMAETSDGVIVHFWRGNVQKLTLGQQLDFVVELSGPEVGIKCHIACDGIVGTLVSFTLKPGLAASEFPPPKLKIPTQPPLVSSSGDDEDFGEDALDDSEMLAAADCAEAVAQQSDYGSDGFADIDDLEDNFQLARPKTEKEQEVIESFQMENGKWTCNHTCRDGQALKNGQVCKHKCCHEGLDKPRKVKRKPSKGMDESAVKSYQAGEQKIHNKPVPLHSAGRQDGPQRKTTGDLHIKNVKKSKGTSQTKLPPFKSHASKHGSMEVVDLAQDGAMVSYSDVAPRDYRTLHNLHSKVQADKPIRLPKQPPKFSYASGEKPDLPYLRKKSEICMEDDFGSDTGPDDFPSFSEIPRMTQTEQTVPDDGDHGGLVPYEKPASISSQYDESMDDLEDAMIGLDDSIMLQRSPTPKVDSSFANKVFNFDAFNNDQPEAQQVYSSPLMRNNFKRARSITPEGLAVKYRRIKKTDTVEENVPFEIEPTDKQTSSAPVIQNENDRPSHPSWVEDMDPNFIDSLKDFVDFIE